jgi:4-hydroxy-tetrahydrodipicolinate synthase
MSTNCFSGVFTALVTPFTNEGSAVDIKSLDTLLDYQLSNGVHGVVACGSTGEAATLTPEEYTSVVRHVVSRVKRAVPVIAGVGANNTAVAIEQAKLLTELKVDAVMVVVPPYNKPSQRGMIEHFAAVQKATPLPIVAYNVPGRTGANLLPSTIKELSERKIISGVKEACGSVDQIYDLLATERSRLPVFSGDDSLTLPVMVAGGCGVISVASNVIPRTLSSLTNAILRGDIASARELHFEALPIMRALFCESNPVPVKEALRIRKIIAHNAVRLPLLSATTTTQELLTKLLTSSELQ